MKKKNCLPSCWKQSTPLLLIHKAHLRKKKISKKMQGSVKVFLIFFSGKKLLLLLLLGSAQQSSILKLAGFDNSATTCQKQRSCFLPKMFGSVRYSAVHFSIMFGCSVSAPNLKIWVR